MIHGGLSSVSDPGKTMLSHRSALHEALNVHSINHPFIQLPLSVQSSDTRLWATCVP